MTVSTPQVLHGGIRSMESRDLVLAGLGDLDRKVVVAPDAPFDFDREDCTNDEAHVLEQAGAGLSIRELASDGRGLIACGKVTRVQVDIERFLDKARCPGH